MRENYPPLDRTQTVKLDQDAVTRICQRVVDHELGTQLVADQFEVSRRRVQQLAKEYRDTDEIPQLETPGRNPYAEYPADLETRVLAIHRGIGMGAVAVAHVLRVRDGVSIDNNRVHEILQEHKHVTENPRKQGRRRPWVRFERDFSLVTVHMDWYCNERDQWCLAVEDDASRKILGMIEVGSRSAERSVSLLDDVRTEYAHSGEILEVITDHGSAFYAPRDKAEDGTEHTFQTYLADYGMKHTLCAVGRPQSNGKLERFFQTYDKQRWRFGTLDEFLTFYNHERPHMSLDWDNLETPATAFDRLLPRPGDSRVEELVTGGKADD